MRTSRRSALGLAVLITVPAAVLGVSALSSAAATALTVAADGSATYRTVQAAVNAVPANNASRVTITIKAGTYRENVVIPSDKPYLTLEGLGSTAAGTVIVNNKPASTAGTTGSATVYVQAKEFYAKNLAFTNDYDEAANGASQALALALYGDRARLGNVRVLRPQSATGGTRGDPYAARKTSTAAAAI